MRIIAVGPMWLGSNALSMANGFAEAGHEVVSVDTTPVSRPSRWSKDWLNLKLGDASRKKAQVRLADEVRRLCQQLQPDILFCFKTVQLPQEVLLDAPSGLRIHYSPDDAANPYNLSKDYLEHENLWDGVVTTKSFNVAEVEARSPAPSVLYVQSAYDRAWHRPVARAASEPRVVTCFVGHHRRDRAPLIYRLREELGAQFRVYGDGWRRHALRDNRDPQGFRPPAYGDAFASAAASALSSLVLLNSDNRDLHTCRTFEVPACGTLAIMQKTREHQEIFTHGQDAFLFEEEDELIDILKWVSVNSDGAQEVARRGYACVMSGGHSYADRAAQIARCFGVERRR